ncbi:M41 family metallopeptidase [Methylorubrum suomiense]|uniref:ATP-dependent zinc metalloprotease FtsH n=1 Tax=Methylorubrum suomiense TaxID=144191 RepID=A0ABQ4V3H8_9HYPH|nr:MULTISPECIES: hypothetical protein [Methylobacteriaceae]GJE77407.1 ATP-dependent zinc metalloprotease FtsH [Methylorubrum suomiense]
MPLTGGARHRAAIHEVGHAVVSRALDIGSNIDLSIHDGGSELMLEHAIGGDATLPQLDAILEIALVGRVAEEIAFDTGSIAVGLGSGSDLARATKIARDIKWRFGLGSFGPIHFEASTSDLLRVSELLGPGLRGCDLPHAHRHKTLHRLHGHADRTREAHAVGRSDRTRIRRGRAARSAVEMSKSHPGTTSSDGQNVREQGLAKPFKILDTFSKIGIDSLAWTLLTGVS